MNDLLDEIGKFRVLPAVSIDRAEDAAPLGDALTAGGLPIAEFMFRTGAAEQAIRALAQRPGMLIGAGTVLNVETAQRAVDAGARFIVTPGFNPKVVNWCVERKIPITPGVATPTEIEMALEAGVTTVKFFPAESLGGLKTIKTLAAPYPMARFIPTGGIGPENVALYLRFAPVLAVGGSWIATREIIAARNFEQITRLARSAVDLVKQNRPST